MGTPKRIALYPLSRERDDPVKSGIELSCLGPFPFIPWHRFFELTRSYYRDNMSAWHQLITFLDLLKAIFLTNSLPVAT